MKQYLFGLTLNELLMEPPQRIQEMFAGPPGQDLPCQGPLVLLTANTAAHVYHYRGGQSKQHKGRDVGRETDLLTPALTT